MSTHSRFIFLSVLLLFMLLFGLGCPTAAYADDGTPPPPATEEPAQPPAEEDEPEAVPPPIEEPASLIEAPILQETVATEVPVEEADGVSPIAESEGEDVSDEPGVIDELTVGEVLEAAPEGTEVVVLDENGEALLLVSTEAAEIVATADPMWCPVIGGVPTPPGGAGCSPNFGTPQTLIDNMDVTDPQTPGFGLYEQPGIIYFTSDLTDPGNSFILIRGGLDDDVASPELYDADYDALKGYDLILQGGWSGVNGDTNFTQTDFGANPVQIGTDTNPWAGNITIKDITINGVTTGTGLTVYTQGNINLDNVTANDNAGDGADLDNSFGSGNINISSSTFGVENNGNGGDGLEAYSNGDIVVNNVIDNGNAEDGAFLITPSSVDVSGSNFNGNGGVGLMMISADPNASSNLTAVDNASSNTIKMSASNFNENGAHGLMVIFNGDMMLSGVNANGNGGTGAYLINFSFTGGVSLVSKSNFDGNGIVEGSGLVFVSSINAPNATVELDTISASNNKNGFGVAVSSLSDPVIKNSTFNDNGFDGAILETAGDATIICSQFNGNLGVGVDGSEVSGIFTLNDVTFSNNGDGDYDGSPVFASGGCVVVVPPTPDPTPGSTNELPIIDFTGDQHTHIKSLPLHIVPVNSDERVGLNCSAFSGTELVLPNGDKVILHCPLLGEAVLMGQTQDQLTGALTSQYTFLSALKVQVSRDGETVKTVSPALTVDFVIPEDQQGANFAILHWSGGEWVEIPDCTITPNGFFQARTNYTGLFVLVRK